MVSFFGASAEESALLTLVLFPVLLAVTRQAFSQEIEYWSGAILAYRRRPYDVDRDPKTHDWCAVFNGASGEWCVVSLTYSLSLWRGQNGVYVHYYDDDWELERVERVPFANWSSFRKARLNVSNLPPGLHDKIKERADADAGR